MNLYERSQILANHVQSGENLTELPNETAGRIVGSIVLVGLGALVGHVIHGGLKASRESTADNSVDKSE